MLDVVSNYDVCAMGGETVARNPLAMQDDLTDKGICMTIQTTNDKPTEETNDNLPSKLRQKRHAERKPP
jgi:hypothetical protein